MKVPYDFNKFLKNGEYKESLFNLIERAIVEGKGDLSDKTIYFFNQSECKKKARCKVSVSHELCSDHKEADTELVPLVQAAHITPGEAVMVPSPSGDTILALFVTHDFNGVQVLVDNGAGKSRKVIDVTYSTLPDDCLDSMPFQATTMCQVSFENGKPLFGKICYKHPSLTKCLPH